MCISTTQDTRIAINSCRRIETSIIDAQDNHQLQQLNREQSKQMRGFTESLGGIIRDCVSIFTLSVTININWVPFQYHTFFIPLVICVHLISVARVTALWYIVFVKH